MNESWKPVAGYEGLYEVSDRGRVKSLDRVKRNRWGDFIMPGRILSPGLDQNGYEIVALTKDRKLTSRRVHILVIEAFVSPRPEGMQACHNDGNNRNNTVENLRWDTASANTYDKVRHGTHVQAAQTHCKRGHPLSGEGADVYIRPGRGGRRCNVCHRMMQRLRRAKV